MSGLLLLSLFALWLYGLAKLVKLIGQAFPNYRLRGIVQVGVFALLLPIPLVDELVGGWQFAQLCKRHNKIEIDRENARGRTVYFAEDRAIEIEGTWTPVRQQSWRFLDTTTNAPVLSFQKFTAEGGILIRTLGISEGNAPLAFASYCVPGGRVDYTKIFEELGVRLINRRDLLKGEGK